jgi:hypothetical protein
MSPTKAGWPDVDTGGGGGGGELRLSTSLLASKKGQGTIGFGGTSNQDVVKTVHERARRYRLSLLSAQQHHSYDSPV